MTDKIDRRLEELVTKLAASAPEAPPFPHATAPGPIKPRRAPAWVLAAAGAAAVLVIIGLPFLLFGGRTTDKDVATTLPSTPSTQAPTPTTTLPEPVVAYCTPDGLMVRELEQDGAAGHLVTPLRFVNVAGEPCTLEDPLRVSAIGSNGEEVEATLGTYIPIGGASEPTMEAGDSRVMLLEVGTGCEGGQLIGPAAETVTIRLSGGDVTLPFAGDLGCDFSYSGFGEWFEDESVTDEERRIAEAIGRFAADPTVERLSEIPFAENVTLTLGPETARSQSFTSLTEAAAWRFEESDGFRAYVGPFSALDLLAQDRPVTVTAGPHDHCAGPPMPIHAELEGLRQISIQPTDATSCLEWWVVDLFLTEAGDLAGVTLDLWEP